MADLDLEALARRIADVAIDCWRRGIDPSTTNEAVAAELAPLVEEVERLREAAKPPSRRSDEAQRFIEDLYRESAPPSYDELTADNDRLSARVAELEKTSDDTPTRSPRP